MDGAPHEIRYPHDTPPAEGAAISLAEGVLWIRLPLPLALDHVNVYALDDGAAGWTIVDTGMMSGRTRDLWRRLMDGPLGGRPVWRVIVTHHHPDHVGLAGWFQDEFGAELWTTQVAWLYARMLTLDVQETAVPQAVAFWRECGLSGEVLAAKLAERPFNFADIVAPLPIGYRRIAEGDTVTAAGRRWAVRCGNGHAPEHATLWSLDDRLVIGGDQLLPSISPNLGVYPTEPLADPVAGWLESCRRFETFADETQLVLPGHKLPFTGLPFRLRQKIDNHLSALERLEAHLATPRRAIDCFPALFKREIGPRELGLALAETVAHLNHLLLAGRALREAAPDGAWLWRRA